jgi:hypothetical protein
MFSERPIHSASNMINISICGAWHRQMWETSMEGLISLTKKTTPSNYSYICEKTGGSLSDKVSFRILLTVQQVAFWSLSYIVALKFSLV